MIKVSRGEFILLFITFFFAAWLTGNALGFDLPAKDTDPFSPGNPFGVVAKEDKPCGDRIFELQRTLRDAANLLEAHGHPEAATMVRSRIER
jgi:hypothetical protein